MHVTQPGLPEILTDESFIEAAFDALPTQIAVLDDIGDIVYTNEAWRSFGESNGIAEPSHTLGVNYLDVCLTSDDEHATTAATGIDAVLRGEQSQFSFEYPCHGPDEKRWFTMRAIQFDYGSEQYVLVLHLNITNRKLSEMRVHEQNTELATLNRVNSLIRELIDSLLGGVTRADIETTVCGQLADSSLFHSAYLVERTFDSRSIAVQTDSGFDEPAREALESLDDANCAQSSIAEAIDDNEIRVVDRPGEVDAEGPITTLANHAEYNSSLVVPVRYRQTVYGALVVNAVAADTFSEREQSAFDVLGEAVGYAFNAIENKMILHADTVTELSFEVPASESPLAAVSAATDCTVDVEGVVPADGGTLRAYLRIREVAPETVLEAFEEYDGVDPTRIVSDDDEEFLLECRVERGSPLVPLVEYGATIETATAADGTLELLTVVSTETDVRSIVESLLAVHPDANLLAKQRTERTVRSVDGFRGELDERLTARQREMLEGAHYAGYFKRPRESSGSDIAESFDISAPTFHQHLQASLQKLTSLALERN
ncbi:hypothetical protein AUR64_02735 [Haloprofundus marisrubri]|uniref:Uncharacterized protein n=1 Tax=Haloprofundus marisrubri TaxID=1514971 RepID=A0A0W1R3G4_9EURY|nr:hypothetical protein AUR64_02735 [Haloprofundus marisrubri]